MQTAGDLVALAPELAAGVEHREHDLGRGLVGIFVVRIDGNAATVVDDSAATVGEQRHFDARREARERFVNGVVDDLVDEVMEARRTGRSDVHTGPFADRLQALQNRDVFGAVRHAQKSLVKRARTPRPGTRNTWSEGVFPVPSVYQNGAPERSFRGRFAPTFRVLFSGPQEGVETTVRSDLGHSWKRTGTGASWTSYNAAWNAK